ncbi:hypothetical protein ACEPKG_003883 [Acinetobacter baumannii]
MKPEQFIRKYGVGKAREVVAASANALVQCSDGTTFHVNDLKRLVESADLIESLGGYEAAVNELYHQKDQHAWEHKLGHGEVFAHPCWEWDDVMRLDQAIKDDEAIYALGIESKDHESIYGGGDES